MTPEEYVVKKLEESESIIEALKITLEQSTNKYNKLVKIMKHILSETELVTSSGGTNWYDLPSYFENSNKKYFNLIGELKTNLLGDDCEEEE